MEQKKYKLTSETTTLPDGTVLHRIKALRDFGNVKAGNLGGFIEKESNLSHDGDAWVYGTARVFGKAEVYDTARVFGNARVYGDARVFDNAWVYGTARVFGNAEVCGNAWIYGDAWIYDTARVFGNAEVYGDARVFDNAWVFGTARVFGNAEVYGDALVCDNAWVYGTARVFGNAEVYGDARVESNNDLCVFNYFGSSNSTTTAFKTRDGNIGVRCGCFYGTLAEFREKVRKTHRDNDYAVEYLIIADLIEHKLAGRKDN